MMRNNWRAWVYRLLILSGVISCSGSSGRSDENYGLDLSACTADTQKEFVHRALQDRYYWYDKIEANVDYKAFASPQAVLDHLKYSRYDRFSYIAASQQREDYYDEGQYVGFGFGYGIDASNAVKITFVFSDSPSARAGLKRGDRIISINGVAISSFIKADDDGKNYISGADAFGASEIGVTRTIVVERDGTQISHLLIKAVVTINTVLAAETFHYNGIKYAYLALKSFINPSFNELSTAFNQFKIEAAEKLVLDLRYNGGGLVSVASALGSYIYQPTANSQDAFTSIIFNDKYQDENYTLYFSLLSKSLDLNEVIILTSEQSCSASEMVINGLKPFIHVTVIGATTCGKPIGMRSQSFCDNDLVAINFQGFNHAGFGDFFDGISADCAASDEMSHAFGDPNEPMLKAALDYDAQAICTAPRARTDNALQAKIRYQGLKREILAE